MGKLADKSCRRGFFRAILAAIVALFFGSKTHAAGAVYNPTHNCPRCGRVRTVIYRFGSDGIHYHRCGNTVWYH